MTPAERAASHRHTAAVHRAEAEARRATDPKFAAILETWACNAEARAIDADLSDQPDLFQRKAMA